MKRDTIKAAALQFAVIVTGVIVALAADAAWDDLQDRLEETEVLRAMLAEFSESRAQLLAGLAGHMEYAAASERLLEWIEPDPRLPSGDSVAAEIRRASRWTTYNDRRGVLDGLIASGRLQIVTNDSLRSMLAGWPAVVDDLVEDEVLAVQYRETQFVPYLAGRIAVESSRFPSDYEALFSDPVFEQLLVGRRDRALFNVRGAYEATLREVDRIIAVIQKELAS